MRQLSRKEKEAAILSVIVLLGIGGFSYVTADSMEVAEPAVKVKADEAAELAARTAETVKPVQRSSAELPPGIELRNPFSAAHETRAEAVLTEQSQAVAEATTDMAVPSSEVVATEAKIQSAEVTLQEDKATAVPSVLAEKPVLCGIIQGNGERLALIRLGTSTHGVSLCEWVDDYEVVAILGERVCLQRNGEQQWLSLQEY